MKRGAHWRSDRRGRKALNGSQGVSHLLVHKGHGRSFILGKGSGQPAGLAYLGWQGMEGPLGRLDPQGGYSWGLCATSPLAHSPTLGSVMLFSKCESSGTSPCHLSKTQPRVSPNPGFLSFCFNLEPETWESLTAGYPFPAQPVHHQALPAHAASSVALESSHFSSPLCPSLISSGHCFAHGLQQQPSH